MDGGKQTSSLNKWLAPSTNVIKVNADASISEEGWMGLRVMAGDCSGKVLFSAVCHTRAWWPPEVAEGKSIYMAARLTKAHGLQNVVLESDSQLITSRLSKQLCYLIF